MDNLLEELRKMERRHSIADIIENLVTVATELGNGCSSTDIENRVRCAMVAGGLKTVRGMCDYNTRLGR